MIRHIIGFAIKLNCPLFNSIYEIGRNIFIVLCVMAVEHYRAAGEVITVDYISTLLSDLDEVVDTQLQLRDC